MSAGAAGAPEFLLPPTWNRQGITNQNQQQDDPLPQHTSSKVGIPLDHQAPKGTYRRPTPQGIPQTPPAHDDGAGLNAVSYSATGTPIGQWTAGGGSTDASGSIGVHSWTSDEASVSFSGLLEAAEAGTYHIFTESSGGDVSLRIVAHSADGTNTIVTGTGSAGVDLDLRLYQRCDIRIDWTNLPADTNSRSLVVKWQHGTTTEPIPAWKMYVPPSDTGQGLKGHYFPNADFTGSVTTASAQVVSFASDSSLLAASVRWTGQLQARYGEGYHLNLTGTGSAKVWVDNRLVYEHDTGAAAAAIPNAGSDPVSLIWSSADQPAEVVPASQFYPLGGFMPSISWSNDGSTLSLSSSGETSIDHWIIDWGDSSVPTTVPGSNSSIGHYYPSNAANYTILATAYDTEGGSRTTGMFLDQSFGSHGRVSADFSGQNWARAASIATEPSDGAIVAAGVAVDGTIFVSRFTSSGTPDYTWGIAGTTAGRITVPGPSTTLRNFDAVPTTVVFTPDGVVVAGIGSTSTEDFVVAVRLLDNGSIDPSFGNEAGFGNSAGGVFRFSRTRATAADPGQAISKIAIIPDGKILVGGQTQDADGNVASVTLFNAGGVLPASS